MTHRDQGYPPADTSTGATEVTTDAGRAYLKPLGNRQGPHVLASPAGSPVQKTLPDPCRLARQVNQIDKLDSRQQLSPTPAGSLGR